MLKHLLIPGTSLRASSMALGVMPWGTKASLDDARALYATYRAAGGNVLDTAHIYAAWEKNGAGASERTLGEILKRTGDRRQVILISKGGHPAESFYPRPDRYLDPETVDSDIQDSLDRLNVDLIDLYFLHRDDTRVPVGEIITMLNEQVATGRIRYFGASNWSTARLAEANAYAAAQATPMMGFVASQPQFSLALPNTPVPTSDPALRYLTADDVAWHEKNDFPAFAYSPTAQGYFASAGKKAAHTYDNPTSRARLARVEQLAHRLNATPNQIALSWLMHQSFRTVPILGTIDLRHLQDALAAEPLSMTRDQVQWLSNGG